eukprot:3459952-Pleurochrysis_carterae.AAC.1
MSYSSYPAMAMMTDAVIAILIIFTVIISIIAMVITCRQRRIHEAKAKDLLHSPNRAQPTTPQQQGGQAARGAARSPLAPQPHGDNATGGGVAVTGGGVAVAAYGALGLGDEDVVAKQGEIAVPRTCKPTPPAIRRIRRAAR